MFFPVRVRLHEVKVRVALVLTFILMGVGTSPDASAKTHKLKDGSSLECPEGSALRTVTQKLEHGPEKWVLYTCNLEEGTTGPFVALYFHRRGPRLVPGLALEGQGYLVQNDVDVDRNRIRAAWNQGHVSRRAGGGILGQRTGGERCFEGSGSLSSTEPLLSIASPVKNVRGARRPLLGESWRVRMRGRSSGTTGTRGRT